MVICKCSVCTFDCAPAGSPLRCSPPGAAVDVSPEACHVHPPSQGKPRSNMGARHQTEVSLVALGQESFEPQFGNNTCTPSPWAHGAVCRVCGSLDGFTFPLRDLVPGPLPRSCIQGHSQATQASTHTQPTHLHVHPLPCLPPVGNTSFPCLTDNGVPAVLTPGDKQMCLSSSAFGDYSSHARELLLARGEAISVLLALEVCSPSSGGQSLAVAECVCHSMEAPWNLAYMSNPLEKTDFQGHSLLVPQAPPTEPTSQ